MDANGRPGPSLLALLFPQTVVFALEPEPLAYDLLRLAALDLTRTLRAALGDGLDLAGVPTARRYKIRPPARHGGSGISPSSSDAASAHRPITGAALRMCRLKEAERRHGKRRRSQRV